MNIASLARGFWWWLKWPIAAVTVIVVSALAYRWWYIHAATKEYDSLAAELDQSDPGWRWEDTQAGQDQIPAAENSAVHVTAARGLVPKNWPMVSALAPEGLGENATAEERAAEQERCNLTLRISRVARN